MAETPYTMPSSPVTGTLYNPLEWSLTLAPLSYGQCY